MYQVNTIYRAIQGEGKYTGCPCLIIRFQGCNLTCPFCDTPEAHSRAPTSGTFHPLHSLVDEVRKNMEQSQFILLTGGEPALQLDQKLVWNLSFFAPLHCETNGTIALPNGLNWVTVSPKGQSPVLHSVMFQCDELKWLVKDKSDIRALEHFLDEWGCRYRVTLQPIDLDEQATSLAYDTCLEYGWHLSLQTHRFIHRR